MPEISNKKRKFIKRNFKELPIEELARQTGLKPNVIRSLIDEYSAEIPGKDYYPSRKATTDDYPDKKRSIYIFGIGAFDSNLSELRLGGGHSAGDVPRCALVSRPGRAAPLPPSLYCPPPPPATFNCRLEHDGRLRGSRLCLQQPARIRRDFSPSL